MSLDEFRIELFKSIKGDAELILLWKKAASKVFLNPRQRPFIISTHSHICNNYKLTENQLARLHLIISNN